MAQKQDNTGFYLIGGIFLVVLLLIIFKKPKYNGSGGGAGFLPTGNPNPSTGGGGRSVVTSTNATLCKGERNGRVGMMQRALNRAFPNSNLKEDNDWGNLTQGVLNTWFTTFEGRNAPTCLTEAEFNNVLNTY